jgi:hypothetical protein
VGPSPTGDLRPWGALHNPGISNLDVDLGKKIEELAQRAQAG